MKNIIATNYPFSRLRHFLGELHQWTPDWNLGVCTRGMIGVIVLQLLASSPANAGASLTFNASKLTVTNGNPQQVTFTITAKTTNPGATITGVEVDLSPLGVSVDPYSPNPVASTITWSTTVTVAAGIAPASYRVLGAAWDNSGLNNGAASQFLTVTVADGSTPTDAGQASDHVIYADTLPHNWVGLGVLSNTGDAAFEGTKSLSYRYSPTARFDNFALQD